MSDNSRLNDAIEREVRRISQTHLPVVPPPASRWDIWKSTATTVGAIGAVFAMAWGGYTNIIARAEAAGASRAIDAGIEVAKVKADLAEHTRAEDERLRRLEAKIDAQGERNATDNAALYRAVMYAQRNERLEHIAKDAGK